MSAALFGCSPSPDQKAALVLTYASLYPPGHPFSGADLRWIKFVEAESGGKLKIKPYWSGTLISSEQNVLELRHGIADIAMITPMYMRNAHLQRIQASFYSGIETIPDQMLIYRCMAERFPEFNAELPGLHVLATQGGNFPGILTRSKPVRTLEDLKGLRLRAQRDMAGIIRQFGGEPVDMPMAEVYSSMARGVIDGVVAPPDALFSMHLAEVGRFFTPIRVPRGAYPARAIAADRWAALPAEVRGLLARSQGIWEAAMAEDIAKAHAKGMDMAAAKKVRIVPVAAAEQARFEKLYQAHVLEMAEELSAFGIEAAPIAKTGAALVQARRSGAPLPCKSNAGDNHNKV